jgi:hypothetical protein
MINFTSTQEGVDPQTAACARLLAAVIAQAIDDASSKGSTNGDANAAIAWLFNEGTSFEAYATMIGANAQAMREAMLAPHQETGIDPKHNRFDESKRRVFRIHHMNYVKRRQLEKEARDQLKSEK